MTKNTWINTIVKSADQETIRLISMTANLMGITSLSPSAERSTTVVMNGEYLMDGGSGLRPKGDRTGWTAVGVRAPHCFNSSASRY